MKRGIWVTVFLLGSMQFAWAQSEGNQKSGSKEKTISESPTNSFAVFGATQAQEAILRSQIQLMHPEVEPLRIFFVPHWKYVDNSRIFHLHVPTGYTSALFTHLPSRTVFIDNDRYMGEAWLGYWIAHELGHLQTNSVRENDAETAAREFRKRLKGSSAPRLIFERFGFRPSRRQTGSNSVISGLPVTSCFEKRGFHHRVKIMEL